MTTAGSPSEQVRREHTWEGDDWDGKGESVVYHCTSCGLVTTSTDTHFSCQPRPRPVPQQGV